MTLSTPSAASLVSADANALKRRLRAVLIAYQGPQLARSLLQMATTFLPFFGLIAAMYALWGVSAWLSLALSLPAAGFVIRIFIIQHDCGHGSFFPSRAANDWLGRFCSLITLTPYTNWRRQHAKHHAVWNNLDRRDMGTDIYSTCLTVAEYQALSPFRRWWCRTIRHPLIAQLLLPPLVFVFYYRAPFDTPGAWRNDASSVFLTNAGLAIVFTALVLMLGVAQVAIVQLSTIALTSIIGVWFFSVQHRFEDAVWARQDQWNATSAAVLGSSYLKLPRVLQFFSGNIGFHHLHHLMPRIPNYRLEECHRACATVLPYSHSLSLGQALRAPAFMLWDEAEARMVRFEDVQIETR